MGSPVGRAYGDSAGGKILIGTQSVQANDLPLARLGSWVQSHGDNEHSNATMVSASSTVQAENIYICRSGDSASCGDVLISNSNVEIG
jgi:uncharacterized Zn-binding protein involved in type VI secretion